MSPSNPKALLAGVWLISSALCHTALAADRTMVFVGRPGGEPGAREAMAFFGIEVNFFAQDAAWDGFEEALAQSKLLYFAVKAGMSVTPCLSDDRRADAVRNFLARGGTVYFDAFTPNYNPVPGFCAGLEVPHPGSPQSKETVTLVANSASSSPFLEGPREVKQLRGYRYWEDAPAGLDRALLVEDAAQRAGMLVAADVLGSGRIIFSTAIELFGTQESPLLANFLEEVFGKLPGPGEAHPVWDPYERRDPVANTVHLATAGECIWDIEDATHRRIVLVSEPVGKARRAAPVEVAWTLPDGVDPATVRVTTRAGEELPVQVMDSAGTRFATAVDLRAYDDKLLYFYCGGRPSALTEWGPPRIFEAARRPDGILLRSDRLECVLGAATPRLQLIRPYGAGGNMLTTWGPTDRNYGYQSVRVNSDLLPLRRNLDVTLVDGPVAKQVRYANESAQWVYTLFRDSGILNFRVTLAETRTVRRETGWQTGESNADDALWYEAEDGLKKCPVGWRARVEGITEHMKERWVAIADDRTGEAGASFLQDGGDFSVSFYDHYTQGERVDDAFDCGPEGVSGAYVAVLGGPSRVREHYIDWKNPPVVTQGSVQTRGDQSEPKRARFGEDFLVVQGSLRRFWPVSALDDEEAARRTVQFVRSKAGNVALMGRKDKPDYYPVFLDEAHRQNVSVFWDIYFNSLTREPHSPLDNLDAWLEAVAYQGQYGGDGFYLVDEFAYMGSVDVDKEHFRKTYGHEMPEQWDPSKLGDDPAMAELSIWRMDMYTRLLRAMHDRAQELSPGALTYVVTAPGQYEIQSYNDLEKMTEFLGTANSDLYSTSHDYVRWGMQHIRGSQGNFRPVLSTPGGLIGARGFRSCLSYHLMNGANAVWHYTVQHRRSKAESVYATVPIFELIRDTPLGGALARGRLVRYAAVLHERSSFLDCIREGDINRNLTALQVRVKNRGAMRNVPIDVLFASHLAEELPGYRVLVVPSGRKMSPESAQTIMDWVRQGGRVIFEGEAIPGLPEPYDVTAFKGPVTGQAAPFLGRTYSTSSQRVPLDAGDSRVLASAAGDPVVTMSDAGRGAVVNLALLDGPNDLVETLVRTLGGPLPYEPDEKSGAMVRLSVSTTGADSVLMLFNEHFNEAQDVMVKLRDAALPATAGPRVAVNVSAGTRELFTDSLEVRVPPTQPVFVLLTAEAGAIDIAQAGDALGAPAYAPEGGMSFLKLKPKKRAAGKKRVRKPNTVYAAVFNAADPPAGKRPPDYGETAILNALAAEKGVEAAFLDDLGSLLSQDVDVLVMPNMQNKGSNWPTPEDWRAVREFVTVGGGVLLVHSTVGFADFSPVLFPEIGGGPDYVKVRGMKVVQDHPVVNAASVKASFPTEVNDPAFLARFRALELPVDTEFQSGFPDYVRIEPGPSGKVLVKSMVESGAGDDPTVVAGSVGRGRVVLSGMDLGVHCVHTVHGWEVRDEISPQERAILVNAVFWLAGR